MRLAPFGLASTSHASYTEEVPGSFVCYEAAMCGAAHTADTAVLMVLLEVGKRDGTDGSSSKAICAAGGGLRLDCRSVRRLCDALDAGNPKN